MEKEVEVKAPAKEPEVEAPAKEPEVAVRGSEVRYTSSRSPIIVHTVDGCRCIKSGESFVCSDKDAERYSKDPKFEVL